MRSRDCNSDCTVSCCIAGTSVFTRPLAVRFLNKDTLKTNVDRVVGMEGVVTEEISNLAGTGKVSLGGNVWTARTENEGGTIPVDAVVTVLRVEGVKLIVKVKEKRRRK